VSYLKGMKSFLRIATALLALASVSLAAEMTRLQVVVRNLDGKPVEHASVVLKFVSSTSKIKLGKTTTTWEARTNQEGIMKVPPMPQGKIQVQVIAKGFQTFGQVFDVNEADKTIEVKLNPPQPQYSAHQ
jgi:Carboxypeptidase regulatory-like domain